MASNRWQLFMFNKKVIDKNTILIFDEFIMNDKWEEDQFNTLNEFCISIGAIYKVLAILYL